MTTEFEEPGNKIFADFTRPKSIDEPVIVSRFLPDNSKEEIGKIYHGFDEEDNLTYTCVDRSGKLLFPPTDDYCQAESRFELYAKQLTVKAISQDRGQGFKDRIDELKQIRNNKQQENEREIIK